ncbi:unnamed protein product [Arabis nemorensis]|uniref:Uncharacterized protein n=1 Tax=Arabis nemorensis TaxID=586526 RepID=A0A565CBP8_9BRAS|nr:unnamed protein product [Arabis nemorensis]
MFVDQLDREGLIMLDQFEGLQLTPSESSHLMDIFNKVPLPDADAPRSDQPMDRKISDSSFQKT